MIEIENEPSIWKSSFPWPQKTDHKYTRGHLVIVGGSDMTGASRLAAKTSRRIGAGITTLLCPEVAKDLYQTTLLGTLVHSYKTLDNFSDFIEKKTIDAIVIGPGLLATKETRTLVDVCLRTLKPLVLDAGALSCYQEQSQSLFELLHEKCILTPHVGEFNRIFHLSDDRALSTLEAAKVCGSTVLLKGAESIIASFPPSDKYIVNKNGSPFLATAGTGDVLAGMIGGLMAQGIKPSYAGAISCWIQGEAAQLFGPGLIAEDLIDLIPKVLKTLKEDP